MKVADLKALADLDAPFDGPAEEPFHKPAVTQADLPAPTDFLGEPRFSCAISSQQTVLAIPHAIPIVHAGPGCSSKVCAFETTGAGFQGDGYAGGNNVPSSNMTERDVVFGGERKLEDLVEASLEVMKGDLFVIMAGCTSGIIGDDVKRVARDFAEQGYPVVGAETSGFRGNTYFGHELVVEEIIDQFVCAGNPEPHVERGLVNVFASVPNQDPFWRRDLEELKRLLEAIGLRVNILFGWSSAGVSEWKDIPNAQANIVVSPWVGLGAARKLKEKFGTPYLHVPLFPVGARATSEFLREVADELDLPHELVEDVIAREERRYWDYCISLANFLSEMFNHLPHEAYITADSHYGLGLADFLANDLGITVRQLSVIDDPPTERDRHLVQQAAARIPGGIANVLRFHADGYQAQKEAREKIEASDARAVILASTWEDQLAKESGSVLLHVSLPINDDVIVNRGYFGYDGGLRLAEDLYAGIFRGENISQLTQE